MSKKSKRVYTAEVPDDLPEWVTRIGNTMHLAGLLFWGTDGEFREVLFAGCSHQDPFLIDNPSPELWAEILKRSDDPVYLEGGEKPWLRKAERLVSGLVQQQIWARDGFKCGYCGIPMGQRLMTVDHFLPLELGGVNDTTNYLTACKTCNLRKGDMNPIDWCRQEELEYSDYARYVKANQKPESSLRKPPFQEIPF